MSDVPQPGLVGWVDLTVDNAPEVRDFYRAVIGWEYREVAMDEGYADYSMTTMEGQDVTGICHARGPNADPSSGLRLAPRDAESTVGVAAARRIAPRPTRTAAPLRPRRR